MRTLIAILFLVAISACAPIAATLPAPATVAEQTKLDEQSAITVNLAYKAWTIAVETGVSSGTIKGQLAGKVAELDNQLYSLVHAVDAAYAAGNAESYAAAIANFNVALQSGYSALHGGQ